MTLIIETLQDNDLEEAIVLIENSFFNAVAPMLGQEGIISFLQSINIESMRQRLYENQIIICREHHQIVGVAELRDNHLN